MKKAVFPGSKGYTFIELLVSVTILGFVVAPCLALFTGSFASIVSAGRQSSAANLCREKIEIIKALGYDEAFSLYEAAEGLPHFEAEIPGRPWFRRSTTINQVTICTDGPPHYSFELLQIEVTVFWTVYQYERSEKVVSYLADR